jgi:von Willebrand factor type A domain-containing protein
MKRVDRSIVLLTMSALDTLATAIGVFVLLVALLMPYYQNSFDLEATITQLRVAHERSSAELENVKEQIAEESAKADAALMQAQQVSARAAAIEAKVQRQPEPSPRLADGTKARVVDALDLVFVIDTTASMGPVIGEVAMSLTSVVRVLERMVPSIRIGVSAYNDRDTGQIPVVVLPLTSANEHLDRVLAFLEQLSSSTVGSRTIEEDVGLGLEAAMLMNLRPDVRQTFVLIGDASVHLELVQETLYRVRNFVAGHKQRTISALYVPTPSSIAHGEDIPITFFRAVAEAGKGNYTDHTGRMMESVLLSVLTPDRTS